jgi:hypothetical protein
MIISIMLHDEVASIIILALVPNCTIAVVVFNFAVTAILDLT